MKFLENGGVSVPVICDVNQLNSRKANAESFAGKAEIVEDYRRILDSKDIDAVVIATPDHWHAIQMIHACQAGKDVYVEKPMCYCIAEGQRMIQAARRLGRVVQVGSQQLSGAHYQEAARFVQSGGIGKVSHVRAWNVRNLWPGMGFPPDAKPPVTLNWDVFLGPSPAMPYNPVKASGQFRRFWALGGGIMTDGGAHHVGSVHQIIGQDRPFSAVAAGGKFVTKDIFETPDTVNAFWEYSGFTFEYTVRDGNGYSPDGNSYGIVFHGTDASLYIDRVGFEVVPEIERAKFLIERVEHVVIPEKDRVKARKVGHPRVDVFRGDAMDVAHVRNFLDCMRSRKRPIADVEAGYRAVVGPHLANISLRTGRKIVWDAQTETIVRDPSASEMLSRTYRAPYLLPEV